MNIIVSKFFKENNISDKLLNKQHVIIHRMPLLNLDSQKTISINDFISSFMPNFQKITNNYTIKTFEKNLHTIQKEIIINKIRTNITKIVENVETKNIYKENSKVKQEDLVGEIQ